MAFTQTLSEQSVIIQNQWIHPQDVKLSSRSGLIGILFVQFYNVKEGEYEEDWKQWWKNVKIYLSITC